MFLLDTNVVSELRRVRPHGAVVEWLRATPREHLFLSAVTIGEMQAGVELTREQDAAKAAEIEGWIDSVAQTFSVLPADSAVFRRWALLMHRRAGDLSEDAMIAATALVHNLTVATRNVRDFDAFGVGTLNPFR
ncbi:MAG: type II toxin-antitoxin system VapC family toxin [Alphaproteobacteria bacterium]|nr:MAG: type II toxin-antitoxin system VapC family toxin [Alphaproteobacteria bacterium]